MEEPRPKNICPPPPGPKRPLNFNVHVTGSRRTLSYELQPTNADSKPYLGEGNKMTLPHGDELYDITFHLVGDGSARMVFDSGQPICAHESSSCPKRDSGMRTDQLRIKTVTRKSLTIQNRNQKQVEIGYTLFFLEEPTCKLVDPPFDPIMDNGGGGGNFE